MIEARRTGLAGALSSPAGERLSERAHQDREIVYFLQPPETHSFDLYHDYTESRLGVDRYLNVVRKGSAASSSGRRQGSLHPQRPSQPGPRGASPLGAIAAQVSETPDGRIRLDFVNPRPDEIAVLIQARRRPALP
ncbi:MAG TPA: hypothetical protein VNJ70_05335 [Thermoanaerobaculia bacterium]|nr:hypothetical protein [Thermoanaerobaculia bacterium]